jgi:hypothetical protein
MKILGNNDHTFWSYRFVCACGVKLEGMQKDLKHGREGEPEMACPRCNRTHVIARSDIPENILRSY